jgi:hypothetical protein
MKISKRSIIISLSLAMLLAFSMLTGCVSSKGATTAKAELTDSSVRADAGLWNADELGWADLTKAEQALWGVLGWNEAGWEGEAKQPASEDKYWKQLSDAEQDACTKLGYTKRTWDGS